MGRRVMSIVNRLDMSNWAGDGGGDGGGGIG